MSESDLWVYAWRLMLLACLQVCLPMNLSRDQQGAHCCAFCGQAVRLNPNKCWRTQVKDQKLEDWEGNLGMMGSKRQGLSGDIRGILHKVCSPGGSHIQCWMYRVFNPQSQKIKLEFPGRSWGFSWFAGKTLLMSSVTDQASLGTT